MATRYYIIIGLLIYIAYELYQHRKKDKRTADRVKDIHDHVNSSH